MGRTFGKIIADDMERLAGMRGLARPTPIQRIDLARIAADIARLTRASNFGQLDPRTMRALVDAHSELIGELRTLEVWPKDPRREVKHEDQAQAPGADSPTTPTP